MSSHIPRSVQLNALVRLAVLVSRAALVRLAVRASTAVLVPLGAPVRQAALVPQVALVRLAGSVALVVLVALGTLVVALVMDSASAARAAQAQTNADIQAAVQPTEDLPIFDAHIHYNRDVWSLYSVDEALAILDQAGIYKAFVSSTPDEGSLQLAARAPDRIVLDLRPYRTPSDPATWTRDPSIVTYLEERLPERHYAGIGEFHLMPGEVQRNEVPREVADLAVQRGLILHAHCAGGRGAAPVAARHTGAVGARWHVGVAWRRAAAAGAASESVGGAGAALRRRARRSARSCMGSVVHGLPGPVHDRHRYVDSFAVDTLAVADG